MYCIRIAYSEFLRLSLLVSSLHWQSLLFHFLQKFISVSLLIETRCTSSHFTFSLVSTETVFRNHFHCIFFSGLILILISLFIWKKFPYKFFQVVSALWESQRRTNVGLTVCLALYLVPPSSFTPYSKPPPTAFLIPYSVSSISNRATNCRGIYYCHHEKKSMLQDYSYGVEYAKRYEIWSINREWTTELIVIMIII
jgi:hypothetical protein